MSSSLFAETRIFSRTVRIKIFNRGFPTIWVTPEYRALIGGALLSKPETKKIRRIRIWLRQGQRERKKWPLKIIDYFNRIRVIEVYKRLLWLGREWHQGPKKFNRSLNAAFSKNKNESDPEKIEKLIAHAEFVEKEIMALYSLKDRLIYNSVDCQWLFLTSSDTEWQTPPPPEFPQNLCDADTGQILTKWRKYLGIEEI